MATTSSAPANEGVRNVTTPDRRPGASLSQTLRSGGWGPRLGYSLLMLVLGYLVVLPLYRLQSLAFEDGARGYRAQYGRPDIAEVIWTTVQLALGSLVIAMVLGTV